MHFRLYLLHSNSQYTKTSGLEASLLKMYNVSCLLFSVYANISLGLNKFSLVVDFNILLLEAILYKVLIKW